MIEINSINKLSSTMNKLNIFLLTFFFIFSINSSAQIDQYQSDIVKLLNCNGTIEKYDFEYEKTLTSLRVRIAAENHATIILE